MTKDEREFLNDVKNAVSDYNCSFTHYREEHYDGTIFCVDVEVDYDEYVDNNDEIWDALLDVACDWNNGNDIIDQEANVFKVGFYIDD